MIASVYDVIAAAAGRFGVSLPELVGAARPARLVLARHGAMWLAASLTSAPYAAIGRALGDRDRATVRHGVETIELRLMRMRMGCGTFEDHVLAMRLDQVTEAFRAREAA